MTKEIFEHCVENSITMMNLFLHMHEKHILACGCVRRLDGSIHKRFTQHEKCSISVMDARTYACERMYPSQRVWRLVLGPARQKMCRRCVSNTLQRETFARRSYIAKGSLNGLTNRLKASKRVETRRVRCSDGARGLRPVVAGHSNDDIDLSERKQGAKLAAARRNSLSEVDTSKSETKLLGSTGCFSREKADDIREIEIAKSTDWESERNETQNRSENGSKS